MGVKFGSQFSQFKIGGDGEERTGRAAGPLRHSQQSNVLTSVKKAGATPTTTTTQRVDVAAALKLQLQVKRLSCGCGTLLNLGKPKHGARSSTGVPHHLGHGCCKRQTLSSARIA